MTKDEGKHLLHSPPLARSRRRSCRRSPITGSPLRARPDRCRSRSKEKALREGRHAIELMSVEKDSINGTHMIAYFAIIAAWVGEKDLACEQLTIATRLPGSLSYGQLKLLPYWNPLRAIRASRKSSPRSHRKRQVIKWQWTRRNSSAN